MLMPLALLFVIIFLASFILTMVGLWGGVVVPSPLFVLLKLPVTTAVSASLFLNGIAAISAAIIYFRHYEGLCDIRI